MCTGAKAWLLARQQQEINQFIFIFSKLEIPIQALHLFPRLDEKLLELLRSLSPEDWNKPTLAKQWTVKDIAAHLLDGNLRTTSIIRDEYFGEKPENINSYQDLVAFLNRLNADWVKAMKRISPKVLITLLEASGKEYIDYLTKLDPFAKALFPVDWAGESESQYWFHIAREYTEKWHHQQQIREAVGAKSLITKEFFLPLIQTFMRALPHNYRSTAANDKEEVRVTVTGDCGGEWITRFENGKWNFVDKAENVKCRIALPPDTAWKLFTKALTAEQAREQVNVNGDERLAKPLLTMVAVMA